MREGYVPAGTVTSLHKAAKQAEFLDLLAFQAPALPMAPEPSHYSSRPGVGLAGFLWIPTKFPLHSWNGHIQTLLDLCDSQLHSPKTTPFHGGRVLPWRAEGSLQELNHESQPLEETNAKQGTSLGLLQFLLIKGEQDLHVLALVWAFQPQHLTFISFLSKEPKALGETDLLHALSVVSLIP